LGKLKTKAGAKASTLLRTDQAETAYKAYQGGNVAIDTDAQRLSVTLGSKCSSINGKMMGLT